MMNIFSNLKKFFSSSDKSDPGPVKLQFGYLPHIRDAKGLEGKRVIVRADVNVPVGDNGAISVNESARILALMPTLEFLVKAQARIIVISHRGDSTSSLQQIVQYINTQTSLSVGFVPDVVGSLAQQAVNNLGKGKIIFLENLRSQPGEEANERAFAERLASYGDIYVNEAFSASHRVHASIVRLPRLLSAYVGFHFFEEVKNLSLIFEPKHPFLLLIGGAKFDTKLSLISSFLPVADTIFVGGALAHSFLKARGEEIGTSLLDEKANITSLLDQEKILTPVDVVVQSPQGVQTTDIHKIAREDRIVDFGPRTLEMLKEKIHLADLVVWNGPMGWYEGGFDQGTRALLEILSQSHARVIIGGGDTVFVATKYHLEKKISFVSMAGGAMLDFLAQGTLPGITAVIG